MSNSNNNWSHFNTHFLSNSLDKLDPETKERYKDIGERYLGYDENNLKKRESIILTTNGTPYVFTEHDYNSIIKSLRNGLNIDDLEDEELTFLKNKTKIFNKDELMKYLEC